jgi:Uma2 family endonuclease
MAGKPRVRGGITLEEFLRRPNIDEHPYLEYIDGRIEAKVSPQKKHSRITKYLTNRLDQFAQPAGLGESFPELRCTFAGRSIVPDVVFLLRDHIEVDEHGEVVNETFRPPDIHVEIVSPDQSVKKSRSKLEHSTGNGCPLGWLIHPERKWIEVYRPGQPPVRLAPDGALTGEPVLPGFRVAVAEVFGWLIPRWPNPGAEPA